MHRGLPTKAIVVLLAGIGLAVPLRGAPLRAGAAKSIITPDVRSGTVYLAGFGQNRVATGVHDDLYVRCLALGVGEKTLAICAADVIGLFYEDVLKIRAKVQAEEPGVSHLIVTATHNHEGPDTLGIWGASLFQSGVDVKYLDWLDGRIAQTAVRAVRSMRDASLLLGRDDSPLLPLLQNDSRPPYVKDPHLYVLQAVSASDGKAIFTLVNWSDHPETLGGRNTEITADYPHWLCQYVEEHASGTAVFVNGSIGGLLSSLGSQVALLDPETGEVAKDDTWKKAALMGALLGELAMRALQRGEHVEVDSLVIRKSLVDVPLANPVFRYDAGMGLFANRRPLYTDGKPDGRVEEHPIARFQRLAEKVLGPETAKVLAPQWAGLEVVKYAAGGDMRTEVDYVQLLNHGRSVAEIATVPGEIYPELVNGGITRYAGADFPTAPFEPTLRSHLKSPYQFVFGLANDELGYLIPRAEWDDAPPWLMNRPERWYGEINSCGPDVAGAVTRALVRLMGQD